MSGFRIQFAYPWSGWLLFLLIPAILVPLILHFRLAKRFRRTRNRIVSLVLHLLIMVFSVAALSGMIFTYSVENTDNEVILLVDVSDTQEEASVRRDEFVRQILDVCEGEGIRTGIVTFGFDQHYAVPLGYEGDAFEQYRASQLPDTGATDVAAALNYAATLFSDTDAAKIVLITDGKETDERASSVIGTVAAQGIRVDVVYVPSEYEDDNVQVVGVTLPDYHVNVNEECVIGVTVRSKIPTVDTVIEFYDNGVLDETNGHQVVSLSEGVQLVNFRYTFTSTGLHELKLRVQQKGDALTANDNYFSYVYLEVFDKILILERYEGQSEELEALLTQNGAEYTVEVKNLATDEDIPADVETLRKYDQVILNNVSNADLMLHEGLDRLLYSYVYDYGGGLFTVGGSEDTDENGVAHAYNRRDMSGSLYQQMLPVQAIDYTPPVGVIFVIDISSSMDFSTGFGTTKREAAKQGLKDLVRNDILSERDYMGIMTLDTVYGVVLPMTRFTQQDIIMGAIDGIDGLGGTVFSQAISRAGQMLTDLKEVERRHVVIITDGEPTGTDAEYYIREAEQNYTNNQITLSVIGIGMSEGSNAYNKMTDLVGVGHGSLYTTSGQLSDIAEKIRGDLEENAIEEVVPEPFNPTVYDPLSNVMSGVGYGKTLDKDKMDVQLGGFYGVKVRSRDYLVLTGDYSVPLYAQWKFGKGSVGSFMSDLNGRWSSDFMHDSNGRRFLLNVVGGLMPTENIRPSVITYELSEENYISTLNVDGRLGEGETLRGEIVSTQGGTPVSLNTPPQGASDADIYMREYLSADNSYARCSFVIKASGIYRITLEKCAADGTVLETLEIYKTFSFSEEYDLFAERMEQLPPHDGMEQLTERSGGKLIENIEDRFDVLEGFETELARSFDPRMLFMILVCTMFLLDIFVRKFKFKWPHEIVRAHREKKRVSRGGGWHGGGVS